MDAILKKDIPNTNIEGYYMVNNTNKNFEKTYLSFVFNHTDYTIIDEDRKFRMLDKNSETSYKKNTANNKLQINKKIVNFRFEDIYKGQYNIIEVNHVYFSEPLDASIKVKNNVDHDKSLFDLKFKYRDDFWKTQDKLPLTKEMLLFLTGVGQSESNADYTIKTNIK